MTQANHSKSSFLVMAHYYGKKGQGDTIVPLLRQLAEASRMEAANISYDFYRSCDDSDYFVIIERYQNEEGFTAHRETDHFQTIGFGKIIPLLEKREIVSTSLFC